MKSVVLTATPSEGPVEARERLAADVVDSLLPTGGLVVVRGMPGSGTDRLLRRVTTLVRDTGADAHLVTFERVERSIDFAALERLRLATPAVPAAPPADGEPDPRAFVTAMLDESSPSCWALATADAIDSRSRHLLLYSISRLIAHGRLVVVGLSLADSSEFGEEIERLAMLAPSSRIVTLPELDLFEISMLVRSRAGVGVSRLIARRVRDATGGRFDAVNAYLDGVDAGVLAELSRVRILPTATQARMLPHRRIDLACMSPSVRLAAVMCAIAPEGVVYEEYLRVARLADVDTARGPVADGMTVERNRLTGMLHLADPLAGAEVIAQADPELVRVAHGVLAESTTGQESRLHRLEAAERVDAVVADWVLGLARADEAEGRGGAAVELLDAASRLARGGAEYPRLLRAFGLACIRQLAGVEYQHRIEEFAEAAERDEYAAYIYATLRTYKAHGRAEAQQLRLDYIERTSIDENHALLQSDLAVLEFFSAIQTGGDAVVPAAEIAIDRLRRVAGRSSSDPDLAWLEGPARLALVEGMLTAGAAMALPVDARIAAADSLVGVSRGLPDTAPERIDLLTIAGTLLGGAGALEKATAVVAETTQFESALTRPVLLAGQLNTLRADLPLRMGHWDAASTALATGLTELDDALDAPVRVVLPAMCAYLAAARGERTDAQRFLAMAESGDRYRYDTYGRYWLSLARMECAFHEGGAAAALEAARQETGPLVDAYRVEMLARCGRPDEAASILERMRREHGESAASILVEGGTELLTAGIRLAAEDADSALAWTTRGLARASDPLIVGKLECVAAVALQRFRGRVAEAFAAAERAASAFASIGASPYVRFAEDVVAAARTELSERVESLSRRERQIGRLAARGWTNKEIARELRIGTATVAFHMSNVLEKLELRSRRQIEGALRASESRA